MTARESPEARTDERLACRACRHRPEQQIQRAVFQHLHQRGAPDVFAFHPANGGWRSAVEGAIFKHALLKRKNHAARRGGAKHARRTQ
jgi:hypothetical protein